MLVCFFEICIERVRECVESESGELMEDEGVGGEVVKRKVSIGERTFVPTPKRLFSS